MAEWNQPDFPARPMWSRRTLAVAALPGCRWHPTPLLVGDLPLLGSLIPHRFSRNAFRALWSYSSLGSWRVGNHRPGKDGLRDGPDVVEQRLDGLIMDA